MVDLILPGLNGSGPDHWQSWWPTSGRTARRVEQSDWDNPDLSAWRARLADAVTHHPGAILVAHSLACSLVAHFAASHPHAPVAGALLVAPADVEDERWAGTAVAGFAPLPLRPLPFPAVVAASSSDPFVTPPRARFFADRWRADFVDIGAAGHVNPASGFGPWPQGLELVRRLDAQQARHARIA
jgi:predicted alpha/beta hydrolase family esterase